MKRFNHILCVVIDGENNLQALNRAATLAVNNQARLTVIKIIEKIPLELKFKNRMQSTEEIKDRLIEEHQMKLQEMVASWKKINVQTKVLIGISFLEIIREILRSGCDLVIKTAEKGGLLDRVFGSDDMHLLRNCPCPVWLVKPGSPKKYKRILAAVDVDELLPEEQKITNRQLNLKILELSCSLSLSEFSELHIVSILEVFGENLVISSTLGVNKEQVTSSITEEGNRQKQHLKDLLNEVGAKLGPETMEYIWPQKHFIKGLPSIEIPNCAKQIEADVIVMGTLARTGISGLFIGNTAETILNLIDCSVLAVKPQGFITPVTLDQE